MQKNWVLLRGLARGVGHWGDFQERLQEAFPQDHFEFLEIPGNGVLHRETSPSTIDGILTSLRAQSEFIRDGKKVHLLAISLGGMLATAWAEAHPDEVTKMVLINTSSATHSKFYERLKPQNYLKILKIVSTSKRNFDFEAMEQEVLRMTLNSSERRSLALPLWVAETSAHPVSLRNFARQLWAASQYTFPLKPPVPTAMLASENDHFVDVACSKKLAQAWSCDLYLHPWAGHDLPMDDGEWVIQKLRELT